MFVLACVLVYMHAGEGYLVFAIRANFTKRLEAMQKLFLLLWQQRFVRVCCVAHLSCADQGSGFRLYGRIQGLGESRKALRLR